MAMDEDRASHERASGDLAEARLILIEQGLTAPLAPELRQALRDRLARPAGAGMGAIPDGTEPGTIFHAVPLVPARTAGDANAGHPEADGRGAKRRVRK